MEVTHIWSHPPTFPSVWGGRPAAAYREANRDKGGTAVPVWVELSTKTCELAKLSTHIWSRFFGLSAQKWSRLCAYLVTPLYRTCIYLYLNTPVLGAAANGDNPSGYHPNALHLLPTAGLKNHQKAQNPMKSQKTGLVPFLEVNP